MTLRTTLLIVLHVYCSTLPLYSFMHPPLQLLSISCTQLNNDRVNTCNFKGQGGAFALLGFTCSCMENGLSYNAIWGLPPPPKLAAMHLPPLESLNYLGMPLITPSRHKSFCWPRLSCLGSFIKHMLAVKRTWWQWVFPDCHKHTCD